MTFTATGPAPAAAPRSIDPYDPATNAESFDVAGWLATFEPRLLTDPKAVEGRKALTRLDPMLFAYVYLRKHLRDSLGQVTFADAHFLWARWARRLVGPSRGPRQDRRAFVAPRACGKSTWFFLVIPMWAGAHGHARFAAAFADSGAQAELHLATFKRELSDNEQLRRDFLDFCEPKRRHNGKTVNDSQQMLYTRSGFAFAARGIDSTSLGMKVDEIRPDLIIFDDIEPPEGTYSTFQRDKRLSTVQNAILPLNEAARVVLVGTVTMPGSIVHALVRANKGEETEEWISDEQFRTFHTRPIIRRPDGTERSVWPDKWMIDYLKSIQKTRSYKLNFDNDPRGRQGEYWNEEDIVVAERLPLITKRYLFVDPPVSTKRTSDPCGLAVVGYAPGTGGPVGELLLRLGLRPGTPEYHAMREAYFDRLAASEFGDENAPDYAAPARLSRVVVLDAWEVRLTGTPLKRHVLGALARNPGILAVVMEVNQGGELWNDVFAGLPVRFVTYTSSEPKEVRFGKGLDFYQKRRVLHAKVMNVLDDQLTGFPKMQHDDVADAAVAGVLRLLTPRPVKRNTTLTPR